jgi:hypothetical protein
MIIGNTTQEFTILAACDPIYLRNYTKGLVVSSALAANNLHLHVTNPEKNDLNYLNYLKLGYDLLAKNSTMTISHDMIDISSFNDDEKRTFYACNRFIVAPQVVKGDVLILDVDSLIMQPIEKPKGDVGLFFRKDTKTINQNHKHWGKLGKKIMAGAVYCSYDKLEFLQYVKNFIETNEYIWLLDQVALFRAYEHFNTYNYNYFDELFLDWHFRKDSYIWSGKNRSKRENPVYLKKDHIFKNHFPIKEDL